MPVGLTHALPSVGAPTKVLWYQSSVHSQRLPDMSSAPHQDAPAAFEPTAHVPPVPQPSPAAPPASLKTAVPLAHVGAGLSPHGYFRWTGPFTA